MTRRSWLNGVWQRAWDLVEPLVQFILHGPQYRYDEAPGLSQTLLPWPVRLAIVFGAWLLARIWVHTSTAGQVGWTLEYAGVVAISLVVSFWLYIFFVDLFFSVLWLLLTRMEPAHPARNPYLYWIHQGVELINRQLTHIEAFFIWMGVLLPSAPRITFQLPALLGLAVIGPGLIDWITERRHPEVSRESGELQSARRPVIYLFIIIGLLVLVGRSTDQRANLLRLVVAFLIVMSIRIRRHVMRKRHARLHREPVELFRRQQRRLTRRVDVVLGPIFMLVSVVGVLALSWWARDQHDKLTREQLDGPRPDPQSCVAEPGGPVTAELSMFLVADSQIHELAGKRFPGQTELADLLVPAAVRPVELDMLSAASVAQLKHAFEDVVRDAHGRSVFWAHLGDFADLSCTSELQRAVEMFSTFATPAPSEHAESATPRLAGIAPGNHDMSFTGNFMWSPYWTNACKPESNTADKLAWNKANKRVSNNLIGELLDPTSGVRVEQANVSSPDRSRLWRWLAGTGGLVTVTPLGTILHHQQPRHVVAIFVDTSDDAAFDWGIAGLFGTYSDDQADRLRKLVKGLTVKDPLWLVFAHHPLSEMTDASRDRLEKTLAWLDGNPLDTTRNRAGAQEPERRVLALIAAHTHRAETHRLCIAKHVVREIVVGSTIDSPQQGAVLEIGPDHRGVASIRLRNVPTVARQGFTCGAKPSMIEAEECQRIVARLKRDPSCEPLFDEDTRPSRECSELEENTSLGDAMRELMSSTNPVEPDEIKRAQTVRARKLMNCVCPKPSEGSMPAGRAGRCDPLADNDEPLDARVFATRITQRLASGGDEARKELACLSWAASAQQQHKAKGMTFASALRCAFDDRTIPAALASVATLDVQSCQ